ncbi:hypothetical protein T484DRAFT_1778512 [Baffinella frigidus]|nr:hypothetical protein T484DRAFT_1778512 [Cryptophyta sp. CCMP2293]
MEVNLVVVPPPATAPGTLAQLVDPAVSDRIRTLSHGDLREAVAAAEFLFEMTHASSEVTAQTKTQMLVEGALPALCLHLSSDSAQMRSHACRVLGEMAFRNSEVCRVITSDTMVLPKLLLMLHSNGRFDAGLVLNNCAAFCEHSCKRMVECPGLVQKLKDMAICNNSLARGIAIGVFNCLSRCPAVAQVLVEARVVEEALAPALCAAGKGKRHEAMRARAAMAMANLTGNVAVVDERAYLTDVAIATTVKILGFALDGRPWGGVHFAPYSVVYPLNNLAANPENRACLVGCGLLALTTRCINDWEHVGHNANETLLLAIELARRLSDGWASPRQMQEQGLLLALHTVRDSRRGEKVSALNLLDQGVLDLVIHYAFGNDE